MLGLLLGIAMSATTASSASGQVRPTVAIVPPVPQGGAEAWVGYAVADSLTSRLLIHSRLDPKNLERIYPLNVFGWRQALAAARGEGIAAASVSDEDLTALLAQLGADDVLSGSYKPSGKGVLLSYRMTGKHAMKGEVAIDLADLASASEHLFNTVMSTLGLAPKEVTGHKLPPLPLAAMKPFGEALMILGKQSLDPRAQLVLPVAEIERAHGLLSACTDALPSFARAWAERGVASTMLGKLQRAEDELVQAMAQAGEFEPAAALGVYYLDDHQGKLDDALKILEEATSSHLGFLQGLGYLGEAYARAGKPHESLTTFTSYVQRVPASPWARVRRGAALGRIGKYDLAIEETQAVQKKFPDSVMVQAALVSRFIDASRYDDAKKAADAALVKHPEHPVLLTRLSYLALEQGRFDDGLALAQRAVKAVGDGRGEPLAGYAHLNLGHAYALLGKKTEAITTLKQARALGVGADEVRALLRDTRLKEFLASPSNPFPPGQHVH